MSFQSGVRHSEYIAIDISTCILKKKELNTKSVSGALTHCSWFH